MRRRSRLVAATAVAAAAVAGPLVLPAAAHADSVTDPISIQWSAVTPGGPLSRGGAAESAVLTVRNDSGKPADYDGTVFGIPVGPSPVGAGDVSITVTPVDAPATSATEGAEDAAALVSFQPRGKHIGTPFTLAAHAAMTWRVTVGLTSRFPANDAGVTLAARTKTVRFEATPKVEVGKVTAAFGPVATVGYGKPGTTWLDVVDNSGGAFSSPLRTYLGLTGGHAPGDTSMSTVRVDVKSGGSWVRLKRVTATENGWWLPRIPAGLAKGQTHRFELRFSSDQKRAVNLTVGQLLAQVSLATGNPSVFAEAESELNLVGYDGTATTTSPKPSASPTATATAPAASPTPTTAAPRPAGATASPSTASGTLAHTGASSGTRTAGIAAGVFLLAGAAVTAAAALRRRTTR